jgi:hypothetical protein
MSSEDLILLMKAAVAVVLQKEMSLNKRLYAWLLGPDAEQSAEHFREHGKTPLVAALKVRTAVNRRNIVRL